MPRLSDVRFTDKAIAALRARRSRYDCYDAQVRGLGIRVAPSGTKTWFVMRRTNGRMMRFTLGRYPEISLAVARQDALPALMEMAKGTFERRAAGRQFSNVAAEWLAKDQADNKSRLDVERALSFNIPPRLGSRPINTITMADIREVIEEVSARAPVQSNRLLAYLRRLFNWCIEQGFIQVSPVAGIKPNRKERSRDRVLSMPELRAVLAAASGMGYPFGPLFTLLALTGQRLEEVAGARWSEVDLRLAVWNLPSERSKNGRAHIVHLAQPALDIIRALPREEGCPYLFSTNGNTSVSGFSKAKQRLDLNSGVTGWTLHDLRRTFATVATEQLGIQPVVVDRILNHVSGAVKGISAVYQKGQYFEQRKAAMASFADLLTRLTTRERDGSHCA
jgi:integrase